MSEKKKLVRSVSSRKIAGICGGLGEYFGLTPTIFRAIFLLLCLPGGVPGPILYILFWIFMPGQRAPITFYTNAQPYSKRNDASTGSDYTETIDI